MFNSLKIRIGGENVSEKNVTIRLAEYIQKKGISTNMIAMETGIAEKKMQTNATYSLSAAEFLALCAYLNVRPEDI